MARLRIGLNHLRDYKFKQFSGNTKIFFEILDPKLKRQHTIYFTALHIEMKEIKIIEQIKIISIKILEKADSILSQIPPYFDSSFDCFTNTFILNSTAQYILATKRF